MGSTGFVAGALHLVALVGTTHAQCVTATPVGLQSATATFSQTCGGSWLISRTLDSNPATGWAIYESGSCGSLEFTFNQTAAFETATDIVDAAPGQPVVLEISLFSGGFQGNVAPHTLGLFRLSVTGDARSTFADGLATGGDVTANWVVLIPESVSATGTTSAGVATNAAPPTLTVQPNGSVLAGGASPEYTRYTIRAASPLSVVTGLRLELFDENGTSNAIALGLPTGGPGRAINGNIVLRELSLGTRPCIEVCDQPDPALACPTGTAEFTVGAGGIGPFSYAWQVEDLGFPGGWRDLTDGPLTIDSLYYADVSGSASGTLQVQLVSPDTSRRFRAVATGSCGSATSEPATLRICLGDFNCDNAIDGDDVIGFFASWDAGLIEGDVSGDGSVDGDDVIAFFGAWDVGC
jgi:hypothetical protein